MSKDWQLEIKGLTPFVYDFSQGSREMRDLLGGKGANVAEMTRLLGAERVPAGFTITTEACVAYLETNNEPATLSAQVAEALARLETLAGKRLGDRDDPLLVSVRSGARDSMPGMMDTVLNLGLNDKSVEGLAKATGNPRFAWDSYRRFVQMFANVVRGVASEALEEQIAAVKKARGVALDTDLDVEALRELTSRFMTLYREQTGQEFPQEPGDQLAQSIRAVFDSWMGERAIAYRRINRIPDDWGTAVNVQQMVFGNKGLTSGSGVAFSRDEITGEPRPSGDFLLNAQGEDVVSGARTPQDLSKLATLMPAAYAQLTDILALLESHYMDMQDTEFTIEEGRLYMLQTRSAKRPAQAAVRFGVDAVSEGLLTKAQALLTIDASTLDTMLHNTIDPQATFTVLTSGVAASPGAAQGKIVFDSHSAIAAGEAGRSVILVRPFTEADDVAGFHAAKGILTSEGGKASHAALVARGMGRPCVCGAGGIEVDLATKTARVGDVVLAEGDEITINGTTGEVIAGVVALVSPEPNPSFLTVLEWADDLRRLGVRANADTPDDAIRAREYGAEGIGLCRTEHMFMAADRQPKMRAMILADNETQRRDALAELRPLQQQDFEGLFEAMAGLPVTIRLLDPPLHEFLPKLFELKVAAERARLTGEGDIEEIQRLLDRVEVLNEVNPMIGTRGCRLGILHPEIYEMQVEAIAMATVAVRDRTGEAPHLEVMIPLVNYEQEIEMMRELVVRVAHDNGLELGPDFIVGTMIELPRACLVAEKIADHADFFSFGTNDLTQTTLGFSRDDIESSILARYIDRKIVDRSPFETLDPAVGELIKMAGWNGRSVKHDLKLGVCGAHGGDPDSIAFFDANGLDYVSCPPIDVPVARIAAAQAAIRRSLE